MNRARALPTFALIFAFATTGVSAGTTTGGASFGLYKLSSSAQPGAIVAGPNGELWFGEAGTDGLGTVTTGGSLSTWSGLSAAASGLATDSAGDLWVSEGSTDQIAKVTPGGAVTQFKLSGASGTPAALTVGTDGNIWFAEASASSTTSGTGSGSATASSGTVGRISPTGTFSQFALSDDSYGAPAAITTGPDGNVWFTLPGGTGAIGRITPAGKVTLFPLTGSGYGALTAITAGPDGNVWFTEGGALSSKAAIGKITPSGTITQYTTGLTGYSDPQGITAGPDGNLWFTEANTGSIGRITPTGTIAEYQTGLSFFSRPAAISAGPDGNIWFTAPGYPSYVGRLVLSTAAATTGSSSGATVNAGGSPTSSGSNAGGGSSSPTSPAVPQAGHRALIHIASGTVLVQAPQSSAFEALTPTAQIPVGSTVDATHGVIQITTQLVGSDQSQTATVWDGAFRLEQSPHSSMTTFAVAPPSNCVQAARGARTAARTAPRTAAPTKRRAVILWAHDNHGQYSTRGQNSVATVRGTVWETIETCTTTTTYVKRGVVAVRDLRTHRTVLVTAGHRYVARR